MNEKLFRKKSLEHAASVEQLDSYLRVTHPGLWVFLGGMLIVLAGLVVWMVFGRLETLLPSVIVTQEDTSFCCINEEDAHRVTIGMRVETEEGAYEIMGFSPDAVLIDEEIAPHLEGFTPMEEGERVVLAFLDGTAGPDRSVQPCSIILERTAPLSFLIP